MCTPFDLEELLTHLSLSVVFLLFFPMILNKIGKTTTDEMMRGIEKSNRTSNLHSSSASLRLATELAYLNRIQGIRG